MMHKNVNPTLTGGLRGAISVGRMMGTAAAAGALLFAFAGAAQAAPNDADATYRADVARCNSGESGQDRTACLREAGAARAEARRGALRDQGQSTYERNALARCEGLPAADRQDCVGRMQQGSTSGSVQGGGVLREYRRTVPATR